MENIKECLIEFINNPHNDIINFNLASVYEEEKQYASAFSYYLRCAEFTDNNILASESLVRCSLCINRQGGRDQKELYLLKHAITASPNSLEPYYIASLYYSWRSGSIPEKRFWLDSYMYASLGINLIENNLQSTEQFIIPIGFEVHELYYQKAYAGMNIGKINEAREIFIKILQKYELSDSTKNFIIFKLYELPEPNHPIIPYSKNNINKLKLLFNNSEKIDNNFSQIYQDMYVLSMHNGKMNGTYLEIGAGDYKYGNNTYLLESEFNWTGVSIDFNQNLVNNFNKNRNNNCICSDATTINYLELLKNNYETKIIDYLQLDCDPPNITFDILTKIPFDKYKFGVITYEHDFYNDITGSYREKSREFLKEKGYKLIAGNISPYGDKCPFEDWWIHPEIIDENIWKLFERDNDEPINGEKYMLTKNEIIDNDKTYEVLLQHKHHNNLVWWGGENGDKNTWNWGDQLNPWLFSKIKGVSIEKINRIPLSSEELIPRYYMIGSILNYIYSPDIEVWGSGLGFHKVPLKFFPKKIHAVRGPLTRRALINFGCDCPDVYGDPALLLPRYYTSRVKKEYKYGIIQHFSHKEDTPWVSKYRNDPTVNIIDVKNPSIIGFIDEINKCDIILSESLHGIICSDAYGIPSYHINFTSNNEYNWFKFNDYYLSVGRPLIPPYHLFDETIDIENLWPPLYNYSIKIDLDKLLDACPFKELNSSKFINYTNNNITEKIKSNTTDIDKLYDYIPCHDQKGNDIVRVNKENIQMSLVNASNDPSIIAINTEGYVKNHIEKLEQIDGWGWNVKTNESNGIYIKKSRDDTLIKCSKSSIPVLGVLVCTTTKWIEKQIQSIDFPIENYIIINNNENFLAEKLDILVSKGNKFIKNLKVYHMPYNLGCAEGWNTIIKSFLFSPYWVIVNDDVSFTPGFLKELHETALENQDAGLIHGNPCKENFLTKFGSFDMFLIRDWVIKDFGLFDTNFYPAYQEDYDYIFRLRNSSVKIINQLNHKYYHGDTFDYYKSGQNTKKFSNKLSNKLIDIRYKNYNYFYKKWNICPEWIDENSVNDIYKYPFNNPANKLSMISYDIEFARDKSLHNVLPSCDIKKTNTFEVKLASDISLPHQNIIVIDDFYDNPDKIREYALSLNYQPPENHGAVGYRCEYGRKIEDGTKELFEKLLHTTIPDGNNHGEWNYSTNGCFQWCNAANQLYIIVIVKNMQLLYI